ncbi:MAG: rhodanese-like domain-containing protein [Bacteroidetes bacterium]|nr:rhodanese-like domain-containing protein [Bacteroidota bacterium]MBV6462246.1 Thiosulfate sulfurtransferase GlpE [Flavobacteriales bacterium]WKZ74830.1 MAG: rhodanese-like domain-containing protein [Vicingaceae bacterium]MCL4816052.1 rhodanese-like domain-containing protein [Flavobacteriales bacterium]NOG95211.1 rhodanese-like domain-containing protein [Bacteroidota bacterium]
MIELLKNLFGVKEKVNPKELINNGATILDVRTKAEYQNGHIKGSINIPLDKLESNISKINKGKPIITCCASGMRSASAKNILKTHGFTEVHNGGGWIHLKHKIQ